MLSGVCKYCRCTDNRACWGGCDWIDQEHTVCSKCVEKCDEHDLLRIHTAEMLEVADCYVQLPFTLPMLQVAIAAWQLALRHPGFPPALAPGLRDLIEQLRGQVFDTLPATSEVIRRGFDQAHDIPMSPQSELILPPGI